jgi:hypothetical protein
MPSIANNGSCQFAAHSCFAVMVIFAFSLFLQDLHPNGCGQ